jgi:hypothetical protein
MIVEAPQDTLARVVFACGLSSFSDIRTDIRAGGPS